eukprot:scaffold22097_cov146-Isochrysis_galbana.AAC.1
MSISAYASDLSAASPSHSCDITQSNPSPSSGMVQPVVNEMFATVHAAGSSLLGLFTSCTTFDSTIHHTSYGQSSQSTSHNSHPRTGRRNIPPTTNK